MLLMREVRCFPEARRHDVLNSWSGSSSRDDHQVFWVVRANVEGPVDEQTGFLCDIKKLDRLLRRVVIPGVRRSLGSTPWSIAAFGRGLATVMMGIDQAGLAPAVLSSLELSISPFLRLTVGRGEPHMLKVTRSFEFAAAHRLYRSDWSDEKNLEVFGKCSNPGGHGHNYVLEVTVGGTVDEHTGTIDSPQHVERVVHERVIEPFDHRNLNVECDEFKALIPSVENIARVIWSRLEGAFDRGALQAVRVWETPKTYAEFTGP